MSQASTSVFGRLVFANIAKHLMTFLLLSGTLLLLAVPQVQGQQSSTNDSNGLKGKAAPEFQLMSLSGKNMRLADFKGKVILLDFWATWCAPCREEIPDLVQLQKQYADKGFTVLGVALDEEGATAVKPVAQKLDVNYPVLIGNTNVAAAYGGIQALPTAYLIGRDGRILKTFVGARDKSHWERVIQSALKDDHDQIGRK